MGRHRAHLATILIVSLALLVSSSCGALAQTTQTAQAVLGWSAPSNSSVTGYNVYVGTQSGDYQSPINVGNSTSYTVTGLSASQTYYFAVTAYSASAESPFSQELVCNFITAQTASNGQITPGGTTAVTSGGSQTYSIVPNSGYQIGTVLVDGQQVSATSTYTFSSVSGCHTIAATFVAASTSTTSTTAGSSTTSGSSGGGQASSLTYSISAAFQGSGSISPSGTISVSSGSSSKFTITPDTGYQISNVEVDGASVGAVTSYTFANVSANHSIQATFSAKQCSISASVQGNGGTISPSGTSTVSAGTNVSYSMSPAAGYTLSSVLVNGNQVASAQLQKSASAATAGASTTATTYTFANVEGNQTICAVFSPASQLVADPGPDQQVQSGSTVSLNGSNSTGSPSPVASFKWTQVSGPGVTLSNASSPQCTFSTQNITSTASLSFNLTVTNSAGTSSSALCLVDVSPSGAGPSVNAGPNQTVSAYSNVTLDGSSSSDSCGTLTSYTWTQIAGPTVSMLNANTPVASFVAPTPGSDGATLVFELSVQDQYGLEARGQWTVNVAVDYQPPVAEAGVNITAAPLSAVTLNGTGSSDPAGSSDTYRWTQISGVPVTLSNPGSPTPTFTAPTSTGHQASQLVFMLTVTNSQDQLSSTSNCTVTVKSAGPSLPSLGPKW